MVLTWIDYAVIGGYLLAITAFGSYFARFQRTTRDYFLTGRSVPWWAICFTVVATETSTLTFIGVPASAYAGNWTFLQLAAGYVIGRMIVSTLFLPRYFRGAMVTSYQLLQQRFGSSVNSISAGSLPKSSAILSSISRPLRSVKPPMYKRIASDKPVSSRRQRGAPE